MSSYPSPIDARRLGRYFPIISRLRYSPLALQRRDHYADCMTKVLFAAVGSLFVGIGFLGVVLPGLPTTPFLLVAAGCYVKSSERLYRWLISHRLFGPMIRRFRERRAITRRTKVTAIIMMWTMVGLSAAFAITGTLGRIILLLCALAGMTTVLAIRTDPEPNPPADRQESPSEVEQGS